MKKKKTLFILPCIVLGLVLLYCGVWLFYRNFVWMPHLNQTDMDFQTEHYTETRESVYIAEDELGDHYYFSLPDFGSFDCHIGIFPSIIMDDRKPIKTEYGNTVESYLQNGSDFQIDILAGFYYDGSIQNYRCSIERFDADGSLEASGEQTSVFCILGPDGELKNGADFSEQEKKLYEEGHDELMRLFGNLNKVFHVI